MVFSGNSNKFRLKSKYFNFHGTEREQRLVNSLIKEAIHKNGINMLFIPRQLVNLDRIYGEDVLSAFTKTYEMVFYVESSDSFDGDGTFFGNMGFDIQDRVTLILSRDIYKQVILDSPENINGTRFNESGPRNGDLIYWPTSGRLFEVVDTENYSMFYQLGKLFTYKITVEFFDYSNEKLKTNLSEIDTKFDTEIVRKYEIKLNSVPVTPYEIGEQVYIGSTLVTSEFVGEVESYSPQFKTITIASSYGEPINSETLTGDDSGASSTIVSFIQVNLHNDLKDNIPLETEGAESIIIDPEDDDFGYNN